MINKETLYMVNNVEGDLWTDKLLSLARSSMLEGKIHTSKDGSLIFILVLFSWSPVFCVHLLCLVNFSHQAVGWWIF